MTESTDQKEQLPLSKAAQFLLEECRMVLPGMQALFGFQLIAVFTQTFDQKLLAMEQILHLIALALVAIAIGLVMTPAALHRKTGARVVTQKFIDHSTRLLLSSMLPLSLGICIDSYLIARIILKEYRIAILFSLFLLSVFIFLWFVLPRYVVDPKKRKD